MVVLSIGKNEDTGELMKEQDPPTFQEHSLDLGPQEHRASAQELGGGCLNPQRQQPWSI